MKQSIYSLTVIVYKSNQKHNYIPHQVYFQPSYEYATQNISLVAFLSSNSYTHLQTI